LAQTGQEAQNRTVTGYLTLTWHSVFPFFFAGGSVGHVETIALYSDGSFENQASQFPRADKAKEQGIDGNNATLTPGETLHEEKRNPTGAFIFPAVNPQEAARVADTERHKTSWTPFGNSLKHTQCTTSSSHILSAGTGINLNHWWPGSMERHLQQLGGDPGSGVKTIDPKDALRLIGLTPY
jgi:hypothetical protein